MARSGRRSTARPAARRNASGLTAGVTRLISAAVDRSPSGPASRATAPSARSAPTVRAADRRASHTFAPNARRSGATWRESAAVGRGLSVRLLTSGPPSVWSRPSSERQSAVVVTRRPCLVHVRIAVGVPHARTAVGGRQQTPGEGPERKARHPVRRSAGADASRKRPTGAHVPARAAHARFPTPTDTAGDRT